MTSGTFDIYCRTCDVATRPRLWPLSTANYGCRRTPLSCREASFTSSVSQYVLRHSYRAHETSLIEHAGLSQTRIEYHGLNDAPRRRRPKAMEAPSRARLRVAGRTPARPADEHDARQIDANRQVEPASPFVLPHEGYESLRTGLVASPFEAPPISRRPSRRCRAVSPCGEHAFRGTALTLSAVQYSD